MRKREREREREVWEKKGRGVEIKKMGRLDINKVTVNVPP